MNDDGLKIMHLQSKESPQRIVLTTLSENYCIWTDGKIQPPFWPPSLMTVAITKSCGVFGFSPMRKLKEFLERKGKNASRPFTAILTLFETCADAGDLRTFNEGADKEDCLGLTYGVGITNYSQFYKRSDPLVSR